MASAPGVAGSGSTAPDITFVQRESFVGSQRRSVLCQLLTKPPPRRFFAFD